jgi:dTDP-4-amino-4,6-dideoxygalactose transaminase
MMPIQMLDLQRQYQKIKPEVDAAIQEVLDNAAFIRGKPVQEFAGKLSDYLGVKQVIPCGNGTDALQVALMALDLQPGDEVIIPSFTFIATAEVVSLLKLKPVFADVDESTFCIDVKQVKELITSKTKAIIPVHLFGQSADMEPLMQLANEYQLTVIEDNAQAIGSDYTFSDGTKRKTGAIGQIGCTSYFPSKNLGCYGDGGAISTNDEELAALMNMIANHGQSKRYYHDLVGCNSRLDTLQAAILNVKLPHLDEYIAARRKAADYYDQAMKALPGIVIPYRAPYTKHVFHQYTLLVKNGKRNALKEFLAEKNIPAMIYYPVPAHHQKMFEHVPGIPSTLSVTDKIKDEVLSLPMHTELDEEQLEHITTTIKEFVNKLN